MKHVVVGIISRDTDSGKEYLLMASKKEFGEFTGFFYPPGGHLEEDEDPKTALPREILEELSLKGEPIKEIAQSPGDVKDQITHWWEFKVNDFEGMKVQDEEVLEIRWFTEPEIKSSEKIWPATKKFFNQYILIDSETQKELSTS